MSDQYQVFLFGKTFGIFVAESPVNAIVLAKTSSPMFRNEPYSHFRAELLDDGVDEQIWLPDGSNYTTDKRR